MFSTLVDHVESQYKAPDYLSENKNKIAQLMISSKGFQTIINTAMNEMMVLIKKELKQPSVIEQMIK